MTATARPHDDAARVAALHAFQLLDTPEEQTYDAFTALARGIVGTSGSMISLIDADRQWFKSRIGINDVESPREVAFCNHVVASGEPMVVEDARKDPRFRENPFVTGDPRIRFYAGIPLTSTEGYTIGTLCVIDTEPRHLTPEQQAALDLLGRTLMRLLEARRRMLAIFDAAHLDLFVADPESKTLILASRGACDRLGYSLRELSGMPVFDIVPDLREIGFDEVLADARAGKEVVRTAELRRRDGSSYPVELRADVVPDESRQLLVVVARDLTEQRHAQSEISLLLGALNAAGDAIVLYVIEPDGTYCTAYVNDAFEKQTGIPREEAVGRSLDAFRQGMPDDDGMRKIREGLAAGIATQAVVASYRKDGTTFWNQVSLHPVRDAAGHVTHWISIERDVTLEFERTSALAEEHDRLLALARAARRIFAALDGRALVSAYIECMDQLLRADARVLAVFDHERTTTVSDLAAIDATSAKPDELAARAAHEPIRAISDDKRRVVRYAGAFGDARVVLDATLRAGHTWRNVDLFVFDLISEYVTVACRNVSLYRELEERRVAVLELNQTKSDLITMLAHDFRGPLTSIVGFADLTAEVGEVNDEQREFLDTIKRSALQLSELATDTLTLSRLERNEVTLQVHDVDLGALVESVAAQYADRSHVSIHVGGDVHVNGDDERLRQVFSNLIDNAIKYSPGARAPEVTIEGRETDVEVRVRDYGIGVPSGELALIFDRFARASNAKKMRISGTGFGLYLTKQLVALHGGTIAVESMENEGTTFIVVLPRRVTRRAGPRTLAVLDPERDRSVLAYGLQEAGYRVVVMSSPDEVPAITDAQAVDALVVIAPERLSRSQVAQFRTFARERALPVVAVGVEQNASLIGAAVTLPRPVLIGDLIAALERLLATP